MVASVGELIIARWLEKHKIVYDFKPELASGFTADFLLPEQEVALIIKGEFYHPSVEESGQVVIQREILERDGITLVEIKSDDLIYRLDETMRSAVAGNPVL